MTLQQLRYFLAVVKWKSFSQAAAALYLSQPALSKQISLLEKALGFPLFERTPRGVTLTAKGAVFHQRIHPLLQDLDSLLQELAEPTLLRMGALPSIAAHFLPAMVERLAGYQLVPLVKDASDELVEMVHSGTLDAALVQDRVEYGTLKGTFLFAEPYIVAVPLRHPLAERDELQMQDLHQEKIILHQAPCDIRYTLIEGFQKAGIAPNVVLEASLNDSLLGYSASGLGLSFIPEMVARNVVHKNIVYKKIAGDPFQRRVYLFARNMQPFAEWDEEGMTCWMCET